MPDQPDGAITPGSYNDAKIRLKGANIYVGQNPVMFIVLTVLAIIPGIILFFGAGSGTMLINAIPLPSAVARVIGMALGLVFLLAAFTCILQSLSPAMLALRPDEGTYKRTGGIVGRIFMRPVQKGSFEDFEKLTLAHGSGQNPSGDYCEWWRLTLHWKNGNDFNLGSFSKQDQAKQIAQGFADRLKLPLEEC